MRKKDDTSKPSTWAILGADGKPIPRKPIAHKLAGGRRRPPAVGFTGPWRYQEDAPKRPRVVDLNVMKRDDEP